MDINLIISTITLNVNGLNNPIKRKRLSNWIKKNKIQPYVIYKRHTVASKT